MRRLNIVWIAGLLGLMALGVVGCGTIQRALTVPTVETVPRYAVTNVFVLTQPATTNAAGTIIPPVYESRQTIVTNWITQTNAVLKPEVQGGLELVSTILPPPWNLLPEAALLGLSGWLAWMRRRDQTTSTRVVGALVDNIEDARKIVRELPGGTVIDDKILEAILQVQERAGVQKPIAEAVAERTGDTTG